jgi:cullin-associated NEDD8-dissociated protein 1
VAWALAQIVVVGETAGSQYAESRLTFYDIFVRNAFGNYRDILREASYSPTMGLYLSFMGSKSFAASGTVSCSVLDDQRVRARVWV